MSQVTQGTTKNFLVQYDPSEYTASQIPTLQQRVQALLSGVEPDYLTLCDWFGVKPGVGFQLLATTMSLNSVS
jgi:hypothetical protein